MAITKAGPASRAPSTRPTSVARTIAKRRAKPYKTEQSRVLAKKRKLATQTTTANAPAGFTYVATGTPDLSDRCKELSKQRGLPVYIVNAKPVSIHAYNPKKVSHHIHRIGHHFKSNIVEEACQTLGYAYIRGQFVKESDLANLNERSKMAAALARHGYHFDRHLEQETDDQVRAAIKELFPKIPEQDLKEILRHAWAEGTNRVGTSADLDLPRRVQLAVIARIRHAYTDYDYLLRAFEWGQARAQVEPDCLRKLIEWRGENEDEDDNELEEVIRETIVIDDDDDEDGPETIVLDDDDPETIVIDDDSEPEAARGQGYNTDTSLEISHRLALDDDLGAESNDERSKNFMARYQLQPRNFQARDSQLRQKIGAARESLRNGRMVQQPPPQEEIRVHVPEDAALIKIDGQLYRRSTSTVQARQSTETIVKSPLAHDRPVPSIEPQDGLRRVAMASAALQQGDLRSVKNRSHPATPESESFDKRRRVDFPSPRMDASVAGHPYQRNSPANSWQLPEDAFRKESTAAVSPRYQDQNSSWADVRREPRALAESLPYAYGVPAAHKRLGESGPASNPAPYDPEKPLLRLEDYQEHRRCSAPQMVDPRPERDYRPAFVDAQVAPIQYAPHPQQQPADQPGHLRYRPVAEHSYRYLPETHDQPQVIYVHTAQTPQPVHGAPAAVQQVPREAPPIAAGVYQQAPAPPAQQPQLYHGAPAQPPQFYYPR
ncbi:hypothetical protein PRZ48_001104 [Zasmidium cellare]|uniref:DUF2293 domain-containing protein n=1 Tax=Zasmidium cellare TaxID=395010 RepID=A0ABR0F0C0_ZASCE|nr:hypothetical protein PRZ48_001104 [Zasmidium cellare]